MSTSFDSSPYFLRCYNDLCRKYSEEGCRNAVLIGLKREINDDNFVLYSYDMICGGYILGEILLSRGSITAEIYFVYVKDSLRRNGYGTILYRLFERAVYDRSASVGVKVAIIRVSLKQCIVHSTKFWNTQGFDGSKDSVCLLKKLNLD